MKNTRIRGAAPERARQVRLWIAIVTALVLWSGVSLVMERAQAYALAAIPTETNANDSTAGSQAHAPDATLNVTNTNDSGPGSLRGTLAAANAGDTILFSLPANSVIVLTGGPLLVTKTVTINGGGLNITVSGNNLVTVMTVFTGTNVTLNALTIANGQCHGCDGAGIASYGTLTVSNSILSGNYATNNQFANPGSGGGIYNSGGALTVISSTFSGNRADSGGPAIFSVGGGLLIANSTFNANSATGNGGAIVNSGAMTVTNSTFSGNQLTQVGYAGGAIYNSGSLTVTNSTFGGNNASGNEGGALYNSGFLTLTHVTVSGNTGANGYGGGIYNASAGAGRVTLRNSILANNSSHECDGFVLTADAFNLADDSSCGGATQKTSAQINLGPLANHGGSTQTFALQAGSAAIDAANDAICPAADQRGVPRPLGLHCDVGAFEFTVFAANDSPTHLSNPTTLTATTVLTPLVSLTWNFGDGSATSIGNPKAHTYGAPGDYTAVVTATSGQGVFTATTAVIICGTNVVLNTNDDKAGSLRRAVLCALPNSTITFSPTLASQTIVLTTGEIAINKAMTIDGSNAPGITLNGNGASRVFNVSAPTTLTALIFQNANCVVTFCGGGAVYNGSVLVVRDSTFSGNSALPLGQGAAIENAGTLSVTNSTFANNTAHYQGGGIDNTGNLSVTNSTFQNNHAGIWGGGIFNSGSLSVTNSTLSGNEGDTHGAGIYNTGAATIRNTIMANILNTQNCYPAINADAYNLSTDASCDSATVTTTAQINLGPLANNGGRTNTMALLAGSVAIDAGSDAVCPPTDQRGIARPQGPHCDVGAFEVVPVPPAAVVITGPVAGPIDTSLTYTATVSPITVTQPITYVWQATGQSTLTHTLSAINDSASFQWSSAGPKLVTVTARNMAGFVQSSYAVTISIPPAAVVITGPVAGLINTSLKYTATVSPPTTTQPITYIWQATGQSTLTHTLALITDTVNFQWNSAGPEWITVTAQNAAGVVQSSYSVTISIPLAAVVITGPVAGLVNTSLIFTATVSPITATQPITYVWQATGQSALTHTLSAASDSVNFQWNSAGPEWITVTARNTAGIVQSSHVVTLSVPPTAVVITGPTSGLVNTSLAYTATVSPITTTQPITYVWQATGQSTLTHTLSAINDSVNFQWSGGGPEWITVTARNAFGLVQSSYIVTLSIPLAAVAITGPAAGNINTSLAYTATVSPITATQPITYVWQATGQSTLTHTLSAASDAINFQWSTAGPQSITVTARNAVGVVQSSYAVTLSVPPAAMVITGPAAGLINTSLLYTATVSPITATQPITYVWQATGQSTLTHTLSAASDSVNFQWNSAGVQWITVTARNTAGFVQSSYGVTISNPLPTLTAINPTIVLAGGPAFTLIVTGTNFVPGSIVRWNGADRSTTYIGPGELQAAIPAANIAARGTASITVFNPPPVGGESGPLNLAIWGAVYLPAIIR